MSDVTLEMIDQVLERVPNASYAQAKDALIITDGNVLDAIIYLEQNEKASTIKFRTKEKFENALGKDSEEIKNQLKEMLKKSSVIRVIVEKDEKIIMNIPLTVGVVGIALGPLVTLVGLSAAVIGKFNIKVQNEENNTVIDLGELSEEKLNILKNMLTNTAKEVTDMVKNVKKDDKDITEELINEDDDINKY